jgi:hypothetical protein
MKCMIRMDFIGRTLKISGRPLPRDPFAKIARFLRAGAEPRTNAALQVEQTLAQSYDSGYDGQGPFPKTVEELSSVLALFFRLLFATRGSLRIIVHVGSPLIPHRDGSKMKI